VHALLLLQCVAGVQPKGGAFTGDEKEFYRFKVGTQAVIPAFEEAVAGMRVSARVAAGMRLGARPPAPWTPAVRAGAAHAGLAGPASVRRHAGHVQLGGSSRSVRGSFSGLHGLPPLAAWPWMGFLGRQGSAQGTMYAMRW
jgi:hypothetical protein